MTKKKGHTDTAPAARIRKEVQRIKETVTQLARKADVIILKTQKEAEFDELSGRLRIQNKASGPQFFHVASSNDRKGRYLSKKNPEDIALASRLAQADYYRQLKKNTNQWLAGLSRIEQSLDTLPACSPENLFADNESRLSLVTPVALSDAEYSRQWQAATWKKKSFSQDAPVLLTNRGERVRSKSEKILADRLNELQIPYRYEYPLKLNVQRTYTGELDDGTEVSFQKQKSVTFYPDFTLLAPDRTEIILEHFGLMDENPYKSGFVGKLRIYAENGFFPGNNLIISAETADIPLNTVALEATIRDCFQRHQ